MKLILCLLLFLSNAYALHMSKRDFCMSQVESQNILIKKNFTIEGNPPHPVLISTVLRLIDEFQIPGPLVFHFTDYVGPRKVWAMKLSTGKHVYFSKNAVDLILGIELEKIADEVCRPEWTGSKSFTVTYTNTVLEQFLRNVAPHESLYKTLAKRTGWKLRSDPNDKFHAEEQEFRTEELVTLIKQLMDIPEEVFKKMKLKSIARWRIGAPLPIPSAKAIYYVKEQKMLFSDAALMDDGADIYGEGTILHEMGHAYWYGSSEKIRKEFTEISWMKKGNEWVKKNTHSEGFITEYSMKSPDEDFAEHFSAFVHNPEFLKRRSMKKNDFMEKNIFTDVTYFSTVAENAKVKIDSPTPDTKDPWLENNIQFRHKTEAIVRDDGSKITDINIVVDKAYDDLSGIGPTLQSYEHTKNSEYRVIISLIPVKQENGSYILRGKFQTDPNKLAAGNYKAQTFCLKDMAGNDTFYEMNEMSEIFIDGSLAIDKAPKEELDPTKIVLEKAPVVEGYPGIIITLPIPYKEDIESIHLNWEYEIVQQKTVHVCTTKNTTRSKYPCFLTSKPGEPIKILGYFFKEYPNSKVKLASILVQYAGSTEQAKSKQTYIVPQNLANAGIYISTGNDELKLHDLDVNRMTLKAVTALNKLGGDQSIEVTVPLLNRDAGKFHIYNVVRSPTGKSIQSIASEGLAADYKIEVVNGVHMLKYTIPLKKNPEDGVYIVDSFKMSTKYLYPYPLILPLDQNGVSVRKIKLLERGIKRTFTISDDKIISLN